eukprot:gene9781-2107_t
MEEVTISKNRELFNDTSSIITHSLFDRNITSIPGEVFKMKELICLSLCWNKITYIDKRIKNLHHLEVLSVTSNAIEHIPEELFMLPKLSILNVGFNKIMTIPKGFRNLKNLVHLSFKRNFIEEIPVEIFDLIQIQSLNFNHNMIKVIPQEIWKLKNLKELDLDCNVIEILPKNLFDLPNLKMLFLKDNKIKIIPREVWNLRSLEILTLNGNSLEIIPKEMFHLLSLEHLSICKSSCLSNRFYEALIRYHSNFKNHFHIEESFINKEENEVEKQFEKFIKDPSNFEKINDYSFHFENILDYWKSGHFECESLDQLVFRRLDKIQLLKMMKDEMNQRELNLSNFILDIELALQRKYELSGNLSSLNNLFFLFNSN